MIYTLREFLIFNKYQGFLDNHEADILTLVSLVIRLLSVALNISQLYKDISYFRSGLKKKAISLIHSAYNLPLSPKEMPEELSNPTPAQVEERDLLLKKLVQDKIAVLLDPRKGNPGHFLKNGKNPVTVRSLYLLNI